MQYSSGLFSFKSESEFPSDISIDSDLRHGRNLLWAVEQPLDTSTDIPVSMNISNDLPVCPKLYVNQSESVRLAQELHRYKEYFI